MKHIESSKIIRFSSPVEASVIKYSLVERLREAFHVETVGDGVENFSMTMTGKGTPYRCALDVIIKADAARGRIIVSGATAINASTKIFYALGILALLVLGLFPGTINTSGKGSGAVDFLVFLFLGAFVIFDMNRKVAELEALLDRVLGAVETEFGA